ATSPTPRRRVVTGSRARLIHGTTQGDARFRDAPCGPLSGARLLRHPNKGYRSLHLLIQISARIPTPLSDLPFGVALDAFWRHEGKIKFHLECACLGSHRMSEGSATCTAPGFLDTRVGYQHSAPVVDRRS